MSLLAGLGMVYALGARARLFESRYTVHADFTEVGGLNEGATVRLAGVQIGRVKRVNLPPEPGGKVRVDLSIATRFSNRVRKNSVARVETQGLLGPRAELRRAGGAAEDERRDREHAEAARPRGARRGRGGCAHLRRVHGVRAALRGRDGQARADVRAAGQRRRGPGARAAVRSQVRERARRLESRRAQLPRRLRPPGGRQGDRKSTRLNSSHTVISYAVFCLKKKTLMATASAAHRPPKSEQTLHCTETALAQAASPLAAPLFRPPAPCQSPAQELSAPEQRSE